MVTKIKKIFVAFLAVFAALCVASCGSSDSYDKITKSLTLTKEYEGKNFINDGIGKATLVSCTDGDTTNFTLTDGTPVTIRYYSVNTPESTGQIEKWGKSASLFNKAILENAEEYVLEATDSTAKHDSYGVRYLGYVWYREKGSNQFKNLNLELVENGYSKNTGIFTADYPYNDYFFKADNFAKEKGLHVWASKDVIDPNFHDDSIKCTLKEMFAGLEADKTADLPTFFNYETQGGAKIETTGYLTDLTISKSGTYTFTLCQLDEDGKVYSVNLYAAYSSSTASKLKVGHLYRVVGSIQDHFGSWQLTGITYDPMSSTHGKDETYSLQNDYYRVFDSSATWSTALNGNLFTNITITTASVDGNKLTIVGKAYKVTSSSKDIAPEATDITIITTVPTGYALALSTGDRISCSGLKLDSSLNVWTVLDYTTIVKK